MSPTEKINCVHRREQLRQLNDALRTAGIGGRTILTRAVACQSPERIEQILAAVSCHDAFAAATDPMGEHDFGQVMVDEQAFFWKIDAYDLDLEFASLDPLDETNTRRVLTIMMACDI